MSRKSNILRPLGLTAAGFAWGFLSCAASAQVASPGDFMFVANVPPGCPPGVGAGQVALVAEPGADVIKNAPYSGIGTTEVVTTLADGNRIVRTNTMKYYRDSQGRTRTEYSLAAIGPFTPDEAQTVVTITDPVAGRQYVLHSALKRADVFKLPERSAKRAAPQSDAPRAESRARFGSTTKQDVFASEPEDTIGFSGNAFSGGFGSGFGAPGPSMRMRSGRPTRDFSSIDTRPAPQPPAGEMHTVAPPVAVMSAVVPAGSAGMIMRYAAPPSGTTPGCKPDVKPLPAPVPLGERIIEGLRVTGGQIEYTIEAGAVGNEQPITVRSEQWFSPELGVVVASTQHDPMMGDTTYRLEQISRAEPDPSLFTVPADYTKREMPTSGIAVFQRTVPAGAPGTYVQETFPLTDAPR